MATEYEVDQLVIHGSVSRAKSQGYSKAVGEAKWKAHYNGNPAFCMYLKITKFKRNTDGSVQFTIAKGNAHLCKFPMKDSHYFGYGFKIYAGIYVGDIDNFNDNTKIYSKTMILSKPSGASNNTWSATKYKNTTSYTIKATNPGNTDVYLVIYNLSKCSCNQTDSKRPVFFKKINNYIPPEPQPNPDPYVWRYHYTDISSAKPADWSANWSTYFTRIDPNSTAYTPNTKSSWSAATSQEGGIYQGKWYLTRPVYRVKKFKVSSNPDVYKLFWYDMEYPDTPTGTGWDIPTSTTT